MNSFMNMSGVMTPGGKCIGYRISSTRMKRMFGCLVVMQQDGVERRRPAVTAGREGCDAWS
jgi:hypothetical protein